MQKGKIVRKLLLLLLVLSLLLPACGTSEQDDCECDDGPSDLVTIVGVIAVAIVALAALLVKPS